MKARVHVSLKTGVLDPQGAAVAHALRALGFEGINEARVGRFIDLELSDADPEAARARVDEMCRKLLANGVIENHRIEIAP